MIILIIAAIVIALAEMIYTYFFKKKIVSNLLICDKNV